jgi:hypothetical protein
MLEPGRLKVNMQNRSLMTGWLATSPFHGAKNLCSVQGRKAAKGWHWE